MIMCLYYKVGFFWKIHDSTISFSDYLTFKAASDGDLDLVKYLHQNGANLTAKNNQGKFFTYVAKTCPNSNFLTIIFEIDTVKSSIESITVKRKLERLQFSTSSSFVKI